MTAGDTLIDKAAVLIKRLGGLGNDKLVFHIGGEVIDLIRYTAGTLFNLTERRDKESVLVNSCIRCKVGDKADVRTFRSLNGTHTSVMAVMYVSNIEACALS